MTRRVFRGIPASGGVAAGTAVALGSAGFGPSSALGGRPGAAGTGLSPEEALDQVAAELSELVGKLRADGHRTEADIVEVGALIATDPVLREETRETVDGGLAP